jgi:hypothetical protein
VRGSASPSTFSSFTFYGALVNFKIIKICPLFISKIAASQERGKVASSLDPDLEPSETHPNFNANEAVQCPQLCTFCL